MRMMGVAGVALALMMSTAAIAAPSCCKEGADCCAKHENCCEDHASCAEHAKVDHAKMDHAGHGMAMKDVSAKPVDVKVDAAEVSKVALRKAVDLGAKSGSYVAKASADGKCARAM